MTSSSTQEPSTEEHTPTSEPLTKPRPEPPDESAFQTALDDANRLFNEAKISVDKKQKTLNESRPASTESKNHVQELRAEYDAVKKKDDMKKASRTAIFERIRNIDAQIKTRVDQLQRQKSQLSYRTEAEFDGEIARLDGSVGKVTLVQERENAKRVDQLRQQRKALGFLREIEGVIDQLKTKKSQEKALLDDAESRQLKAEMDQIQERIRDAKAQNDDSFGRFTRARDELQQAKDLQNKQYAHIKRLKDEFYNHKRQVQAYEREASKQRELRRRAERERLLQERQAEVLKQRVEEASLPAYSAEIRAAESLIRLVTPLSQSEKAETGPSSLAAQPQRTVDAAGMKGTPLAKKVDEDAYFVGSGSKKGKKGKRDKVGELTSVENATVTRNIGVFYNQGLLEQLNLLDIAPPTTEDDVSRMLGQLKAKRDFFMDDRARKTTENIERARAEFEQHEAKASGEVAIGNSESSQSNNIKPSSTGPVESTALSIPPKDDTNGQSGNVSKEDETTGSADTVPTGSTRLPVTHTSNGSTDA